VIAARRFRPRGARLAVAIVVAMGVVGVSAGRGEDPAEIDPTGGLRSRGVGVPPAATEVSREELIRQWDLDGNGSIDASEAAVARARMRRARLEMELGTSIDPLTGKPRIVVEGTPDEPGDGPPEPDIDKDAGNRPRAADEHAPPGTRVPAVRPAVTGTAGPRPPGITSSGSSTPGGGAAAPRTSSRPGSLIGGVRAGAPAARWGYGSRVPKPDLNAGLPRPVLSGTRGSVPRGGFLPTVRPSGTPRPAAPPLTPATPPRVTADELGGY
jgi:hypothetical protein